MAYSDKAAGELYQKLNELPNLATVVKEDGSIELFDDYSAYEATFKRNDNSKVAKDSKIAQVSLIIYDDTNFKGRYKYYLAENGVHNQILVPNLESVYNHSIYDYDQKNWNDVISSIQLYCNEYYPYEYKGSYPFPGF